MTDKKTELQQPSSSVPGAGPAATQGGAGDAVSGHDKTSDSKELPRGAGLSGAAASINAGRASASGSPSQGSAAPRPDTAPPAAPSDTRRATSPGSGGPGGPAGPAAGAPARPPRRRGIGGPAFVVALLLAAVLAAGWWYQHQAFMRTSSELQGQLRHSADQASQAAGQARQALARVEQQARQIAALEEAVNAARDQSDGLERAFQTLTDSGSELVLLNDIEHLLTIAQQQLQLSGNIANAVISLETAQAQLARANRPGLASLQQTINGDLDHLRAASTVDIAMMSSQLDELGQLVSDAPLLMPDDAAPEPVREAGGPSAPAPAGSARETPADPDAPWWKKSMHVATVWSRDAWSAIRQDLGQFIAVRRVDDTTALLMSPEQSARFRENLRMRIMTAQLALMMRQPKIWQTETAALVQAIESRFDTQSSQSRRAIRLARQFSDTSIDVPVPDVENSLQAVQTLRDQKGKSERLGAGETDAAEAPAGAGASGAPDAADEPGAASGDEPAADEPVPVPDAASPGSPQDEAPDNGAAPASEVLPEAGTAAEPEAAPGADTSVSALSGAPAIQEGGKTVRLAGAVLLNALQG